MDRPPEETFAAAFGRALERRRVSLTWLRDRLASRGYRVSLATLSYWRAGHRVPARLESLEAMAEIEVLLDVPEGSLAALAAERRHRAAPTPFDALVLGVDEGSLVGEQDVTRVLFHLAVDVDRAHSRIESAVTQVFVAARDGVRGVSMFVGPDADGESNSTRVEAVSGCTIGAVELLDDGIRTVWLEFDRPTRAGDSVLVETRVVDEGLQAAVEREYGIVAEERLEECMVLVRFRPDELPSRCWKAYEEGSQIDEWEVPGGVATVHHRQTAFGPGTCRIRWEW